MSNHPLLLDIFSLGPPQLRTGLGFLFSFKVSFEKHPNVHFLGPEILTVFDMVIFCLTIEKEGDNLETSYLLFVLWRKIITKNHVRNDMTQIGLRK